MDRPEEQQPEPDRHEDSNAYADHAARIVTGRFGLLADELVSPFDQIQVQRLLLHDHHPKLQDAKWLAVA